MSYETDTILTRDKPTKEGDGVRFNRLRVVGPSPIRQTSLSEEWSGSGQGDLYIVEPQGYTLKDEDGKDVIGADGKPVPALASNEIVPENWLNANFSVKYAPEPAPTHVETHQQRRLERKVKPEEQFRQDARDDYKEFERKVERERTAIGTPDE